MNDTTPETPTASCQYGDAFDKDGNPAPEFTPETPTNGQRAADTDLRQAHHSIGALLSENERLASQLEQAQQRIDWLESELRAVCDQRDRKEIETLKASLRERGLDPEATTARVEAMVEALVKRQMKGESK